MKAANETHDLTRPLRAFWVGEEQIYAAYDEAGALQLANHEYGYACFSLADVTPCDVATLEQPAYSAAGQRLGPLWQQVAIMPGPGYLGECQP